jgi:hypothetical protein
MALNLNTVYVKSPFMQVVRDGDSAVIWHSLFGYPKVVSVATLEFLESFSRRTTTIYSQLGDKLDDDEQEMIEELLRCYFLIPDGLSDRVFLEEKMRECEAEIVSGSLIDYLELITPDIAATLKEFRIEISSSLDGLREGNDRVRLTKSGGGTFSQIFRSFEALTQVGYPLDGVAVTVTEKNFHQLDESIIDWAVARGMKNVRIDIDVVDMVEIPVEEVVAKLMRIRRYAATQGVDVPGF